MKRLNLTGQVFGKLTVASAAADKRTARGKVVTSWYCSCDCGKTHKVTTGHLRNGSTRSCGCGTKKADAAINRVITMYRLGAEEREYIWGLSKPKCREIMAKDCLYCGRAPSNCSSHYPDFKYQGIDRVDNNKGYEPDNVVPCCKTCNIAKRAQSTEEFWGWINSIVMTNPNRMVQL